LFTVNGNTIRNLCMALAVAALLAGCGPPEKGRPGGLTLNAWAANDMVALTDRTEQFRDALIFDQDKQTVNLHAAANETVSFQLVVDAGQSGARDLRISWTDLAASTNQKVDKSNILAFRGLPTHIGRYPPWYLRLVDSVPQPANFYDPLIPIDSPKGGQPYNMESGERLAFWVDLSVPRSTVAGNYLGQLTVTSATHKSWSVKLAVQVHEFVLPDARPIAAVGGFDHAELFAAFLNREGDPYVPSRLDTSQPLVQRGLAVMKQMMRLAHSHRIDLFDKGIQPVIKRDESGKVMLLWEDYDAIVMPYLDGTAFDDRLGCAAWPMPFHQGWPDPETYGGADSEAYATTVSGLLAECRRHFAQPMEVSERTFIWPYRLDVTAEAYDRYRRLAHLAREADGQTPMLCQLPIPPPMLTGWRHDEEFKKLVDISALPGQWFDPASAAATARPDNPLAGVWLSPGQPPYLPSAGVIATPADVRVIPWFAMKYKCTGLFLPEVLHWSAGPLSTEASEQTRLFYPGSIAGLEEPLPSVRLKRLRRGLQDILYLWVLQQRGRREVANTVINVMARYAGLDAAGDNYLDARLDGWVQDPGVWHEARRLLASEIVDVIHPSRASEKELLRQRLAWQSFDEQAYRVRVEQVRSRVTAAAGKPVDRAGRLEMTIWLDLHNEYARDVDVVARIDELPDGWRATTDSVHLSPFRAGRRGVVELKAAGTQVPATTEAKVPVPISITTNMRRKEAVDAVVPFLLAGRATAPPKIDGSLDDWPMRIGNTAGTFKLVGRRGQNGKGLATRQTLVFVLCDEENLYMAFRCDEPTPNAVIARSDNFIHYEQLMACGEDLVEVILDPGADARSTEDLYHVVVKPNGVIVAERGVRTDPPLGKAVPWPVAASVAIGKQKDVWIVELAIPISAFGAKGRAELWGVNFTRFATQGAEASSWSGAPRYFYDPRNLGTMLVARPSPP
jgi:hypothetical protein